MRTINTIEWTFKWIALVFACMTAIIVPHAHLAWGCVVLWIIANMFQKMSITRLEKDNENLRKENLSLYNRLTDMRKKQ